MKIFAAILLSSCVAFAAKKSETQRSTAATSSATEQTRTTIKPISAEKLRGVSAFASYNLSDSFDFDYAGGGQSGSGTFNSEKAFGLGVQYDAFTFDNGLGLNVGGTYEMGRNLNSYKIGATTSTFEGGKPEVQMWTAFSNLNAFLTQQFGVFGGVNYNFPQVSRLNGGSFKGNLGFQAGATFVLSRNFALDGQYRFINMQGSAKNDQGITVDYDKVKMQGFTLDGRYMF